MEFTKGQKVLVISPHSGASAKATIVALWRGRATIKFEGAGQHVVSQSWLRPEAS